MYIVQIDHPYETDYREQVFYNLIDAQRFYKEEVEKALKERISGITVTIFHKLDELMT